MKFEYSDRVKGMRPSIIRELLKQMSDPQLISFAGGNPAAEAFPVEEIQEISQQLLSEDPVGTLQYSITEGYPALRTAAEKYVNGMWPVKKEFDDLIVTSGSQQIMDFMAKLLCNEGDIVATENPAFLGGLNSFRSFGVHLAGVEMQGDGPNLRQLEELFKVEKKPRFFYTIPNFQNPTGITMSLAKRKAVYALAVKYSVPILEDNPYGELRIRGEELPPIKAFDEKGLVVYAASLSKILAPGMRVAFCVGQAELLAKMIVAKQGNDVHTSLWAQRVCERFLSNCDMKKHLERIRKIYAEKAAYMEAQIEKQLGDEVQYISPQGGMFLWLTLPLEIDAQKFVKNCLERKLALVPGSAFFVDDTAPCQSVRMNYSTPTMEQIEKGVAVMSEVLQQMRGEQIPK